jgi:hypothetical protein
MTERQITFGSTIRLQNVATGRFLAAVAQPYVHPGTSAQNMVVGLVKSDSSCAWTIVDSHENRLSKRANERHLISNQMAVRLTNVKTQQNLHSHTQEGTHRQAPITTANQEVTSFGKNGEGDANDNWQLFLIDSSGFTPGSQVRLKHVETGKFLSSSNSSDELTAGEGEISASDDDGPQTLWRIQDGLTDWPFSAPPQEVIQEIEDRLHAAMSLSHEAENALATIRSLHAEAASKSKHIDDGVAFSKDTQRWCEEQKESLQRIASNILGEENRAKEAAVHAQEYVGQITAAASAAKEAASQAETAFKQSKILGDKSEQIDTSIAGYEARLAAFEQSAKQLRERIEKLLSGATSVGLGVSFGEQAAPHRRQNETPTTTSPAGSSIRRLARPPADSSHKPRASTTSRAASSKRSTPLACALPRSTTVTVACGTVAC